MRSLKKLLLVVVLSVGLITGSANAIGDVKGMGSCGGFGAVTQVWLKAFFTLYNIFPIRIGGIPVTPKFGTFDYKTTGQIVCFCPTPFPRVGITMSFWEPRALMEIVSSPWCFPSIGFDIGLIPIGGTLYGATDGGGAEREDRTYQMHYIRFIPFAVLNLFTDFICLSGDNPIDILYITEIDPLWQDDSLSLLLFPEGILLANPITLLACGADAIAATVANRPLDPLFWCAGGWGYMVPATKNEQTTKVQGSALAVARSLYKLHRSLVLWGSMGDAALCGPYPQPLIRKRQYGIFPIYPVSWKKRFPIGKDDLAGWGYGKDIPFKNKGNWVYPIYRKRDCCVF